jgi:cell division septation protein DedD
MRIDYSEPKKAYVTSQGPSRPRKEPAGLFTTLIIVTGIIIFIAGFGTGWFLSQKSAKKSFQAATEQNSLENSKKKEPVPAPKAPQPVQQATTPQPQPDPATAQQPPTTPGAATDPPLSFYKTLPSGQKGNVLGSGINTKDDRSKQPLQAAIPANLNKPTTIDPTKPPTEQPVTSDKTIPKHSGNSSFTVQVASFPLKSEAETLKNKLAAKGYHVFIVDSNQGEKGTWYRVRVGKKLEQEAAKELAGKLGKSALVIPERD